MSAPRTLYLRQPPPTRARRNPRASSAARTSHFAPRRRRDAPKKNTRRRRGSTKRRAASARSNKRAPAARRPAAAGPRTRRGAALDRARATPAERPGRGRALAPRGALALRRGEPGAVQSQSQAARDGVGTMAELADADDPTSGDFCAVPVELYRRRAAPSWLCHVLPRDDASSPTLRRQQGTSPAVRPRDVSSPTLQKSSKNAARPTRSTQVPGVLAARVALRGHAQRRRAAGAAHGGIAAVRRRAHRRGLRADDARAARGGDVGGAARGERGRGPRARLPAQRRGSSADAERPARVEIELPVAFSVRGVERPCSRTPRAWSGRVPEHLKRGTLPWSRTPRAWNVAVVQNTSSDVLATFGADPVGTAQADVVYALSAATSVGDALKDVGAGPATTRLLVAAVDATPEAARDSTAPNFARISMGCSGTRTLHAAHDEGDLTLDFHAGRPRLRLCSRASRARTCRWSCSTASTRRATRRCRGGSC